MLNPHNRTQALTASAVIMLACCTMCNAAGNGPLSPFSHQYMWTLTLAYKHPQTGAPTQTAQVTSGRIRQFLTGQDKQLDLQKFNQFMYGDSEFVLEDEKDCESFSTKTIEDIEARPANDEERLSMYFSRGFKELAQTSEFKELVKTREFQELAKTREFVALVKTQQANTLSLKELAELNKLAKTLPQKPEFKALSKKLPKQITADHCPFMLKGVHWAWPNGCPHCKGTGDSSITTLQDVVDLLWLTRPGGIELIQLKPGQS